MPISGRIAVDVEFTDSAESGITKNTKRLTLKGAQAYSTGKVAIVSGTCGSALANAVSVTISAPGYTDASGAAVSFSTVDRVALYATQPAYVETSQSRPFTVASCGADDVGVGATETPSWPTLRVRAMNTSASYTIILYGT